MLEQPKISIIIPVFNREGLILETLNSIANQSLQDFECLIIDDGSTDNSQEIVERYCIGDSRFKLFLRPESEPKGAPACRNIGLKKSKGMYVQFFDSDDLMLSQALQDKVDVLDGDKDIEFVVSKTAFLFENGEFEYPNQRLRIPSNYEEFLNNKTSFFTPGPMFRNTFLKSFPKGFETSLKRHQEWEYYTRMMSEMPKFEVIDKVHCHYRMHSESIKAKSDRYGNLYYRRTKLLAILKIDNNTCHNHSFTIRKAFWAYAVTTLKVALYNFHVVMVFITLSWMVRMYFNQFK